MTITTIDEIKSTEQSNLLIVDDEPSVVEVVKEMLADAGFNLISAYSVSEAYSIFQRQNIDIILTDLIMSDGSGIDVLREAKKIHPRSQVILMTGRPTVQNAVSVLKQGAYDYLIKPFGIETLKITIWRAHEKIKLEQENIHLKDLMSIYQISEAIGTGMEINALLKLILEFAIKELSADYASILINGENDILNFKCSIGLENDDLRNSAREHALEISRRIIASDGPILFNDPERDSTSECHAIKSSIGQPVKIKNRIYGTIVVIRTSDPHSLSHGDLSALRILASKAANAMENANLYDDLAKAYYEAVEALANAIEARDAYTRGHTERVYLIAGTIAEELGWTREMLGDLKMGCLLHDIGKIGVPDAILNKNGPLTPEETKIMQGHCDAGAKIVKSISFLEPALPYILYHHERHDGNGYPLGLAGDEIPMPGRLLAVVDTIDAITSDRPYRKGKPLDFAIQEVFKYSGTQFNPEVANAVLSAYKKGKLNFLF